MKDAEGNDLTIRQETAADTSRLRRILEAAFASTEEADLVDRLRAGGDLVLSLVGVVDHQVAAMVGFSPMAASFPTSGPIVALAPLAVLPERQRSGIGQALVRHALEHFEASGCTAIFVLGDPDYYGRFGFSASAADGLTVTWPGPAFQGLWLRRTDRPASGRLDYAPAFDMFA